MLAPAPTPRGALAGRRLRRLLDRRLLAELAPAGGGAAARPARPLPGGGEPWGRPEFLRLDALLDAATRAATVLALPAEDALADPEGFAFARDFARARGYRLALDLPGPGLLAALPAGPAGGGPAAAALVAGPGRAGAGAAAGAGWC